MHNNFYEPFTYSQEGGCMSKPLIVSHSLIVCCKLSRRKSLKPSSEKRSILGQLLFVIIAVFPLLCCLTQWNYKGFTPALMALQRSQIKFPFFAGETRLTLKDPLVSDQVWLMFLWSAGGRTLTFVWQPLLTIPPHSVVFYSFHAYSYARGLDLQSFAKFGFASFLFGS